MRYDAGGEFRGGAAKFYTASCAVQEQHNLLTDAPGFLDAAHFDYHLTAASPARAAGTDPGVVEGFSLMPKYQYQAPLNRIPRPAIATPDAGAFSF